MIKIDGDYSRYFAGDDPAYPGGKAVPVSAGNKTDGTPWRATWFNTILGFFQAAILEAEGEFNVSGVPDNAAQSDVLNALKKIMEKVFMSYQLPDRSAPRKTVAEITFLTPKSSMFSIRPVLWKGRYYSLYPGVGAYDPATGLSNNTYIRLSSKTSSYSQNIWSWMWWYFDDFTAPPESDYLFIVCYSNSPDATLSYITETSPYANQRSTDFRAFNPEAIGGQYIKGYDGIYYLLGKTFAGQFCVINTKTLALTVIGNYEPVFAGERRVIFRMDNEGWVRALGIGTDGGVSMEILAEISREYYDGMPFGKNQFVSDGDIIYHSQAKSPVILVKIDASEESPAVTKMTNADIGTAYEISTCPGRGDALILIANAIGGDPNPFIVSKEDCSILSHTPFSVFGTGGRVYRAGNGFFSGSRVLLAYGAKKKRFVYYYLHSLGAGSYSILKEGFATLEGSGIVIYFFMAATPTTNATNGGTINTTKIYYLVLDPDAEDGTDFVRRDIISMAHAIELPYGQDPNNPINESFFPAIDANSKKISTTYADGVYIAGNFRITMK